MILARVVGNVVATQKNERYRSACVMLCQPVTPTGEQGAAIDSAIVGVVDRVDLLEEETKAQG